MQGTKRLFVGFVKITLDLVVSSTPNWSQAWKHLFGPVDSRWRLIFVALTTTPALCHSGGSCLCLLHFISLLSVAGSLLSTSSSFVGTSYAA